jgi:serine/threonine protein kinase
MLDTISEALFALSWLLKKHLATSLTFRLLLLFCLISDSGDIPKNVFMVFEYLEFDLTGIIETPEIKLTQDHIKSWSRQLLSGVHYMHVNKIIHRDLKASNLLINRRGELKIADWGLARSWNPEMKRLTNRVITLWYRPPELLLGAVEYTSKIDMWSVGCIIAEMFRRGGLLKGSNESTRE